MLAKTETFGHSLMDIGIGSFIISSAMTSRFARGVADLAPSAGSRTYAVGPWVLSADIIKKLAVVALGIGRLIVIRATNYQTHDTEYGTEWNFFVTLFFLWVISDLAHKLFSRRAIIIGALTSLFAYQYALIELSLTDYIFNSPRASFVSSNREGICSLVGCVALYLLSESISHVLFFTPAINEMTKGRLMDETKQLVREANKDIFQAMLKLTFLCGALFGLWKISEYFQQTSRRLFNAAFVFQCLMLAVFALFLLCSVEFLCSRQVNSIRSLELLNRHQLLVFLVANLMTGLVNLTVPTIYCSPQSSMCILVVYIFVVHSFPWLVEKVISKSKGFSY
jgi:phosphatidylinositol glycan class W